MRGRVSPGIGKTDAIALLAAEAGLIGIDPHVHHTVEAAIAQLRRAFAVSGNVVTFAEAAGLPGARVETWFPARQRPTAQPNLTNGPPPGFPARFGHEDSPAFRTVSIADGIFAHVGRSPVTLLADRRTVVVDYSSRFAGLVAFYDVDLAAMLAAARPVAGTAFVLSDDIFPINYCHWMVDTLPRLAFLGERRDVTLVVSDIDAPFKRESLRLAGFGDDRVVYLGDFQAIRAETLIVPRDTRDMPHPAHKAAAWTMDFLRARIALPATLAAPAASRPRKLYVSRADAGGRRILNDDAMTRLLEPRGYVCTTLAGRSLAEQVALFSCATHVVGLHGAGLANIAFSPPGASLLEIFPASYGMPTYYVLAAGQGLRYASYVARDVHPGARDQVDDVAIDVADFLRCCEALL